MHLQIPAREEGDCHALLRWKIRPESLYFDGGDDGRAGDEACPTCASAGRVYPLGTVIAKLLCAIL